MVVYSCSVYHLVEHDVDRLLSAPRRPRVSRCVGCGRGHGSAPCRWTTWLVFMATGPDRTSVQMTNNSPLLCGCWLARMCSYLLTHGRRARRSASVTVFLVVAFAAPCRPTRSPTSSFGSAGVSHSTSRRSTFTSWSRWVSPCCRPTQIPSGHTTRLGASPHALQLNHRDARRRSSQRRHGTPARAARQHTTTCRDGMAHTANAELARGGTPARAICAVAPPYYANSDDQTLSTTPSFQQ